MPGEQVMKCAECGVTTRYRDMKYIGGVLVLNPAQFANKELREARNCAAGCQPHEPPRTHGPP